MFPLKGCLEHLNEDVLTGFSEMFEHSEFRAFMLLSSLEVLINYEAETGIAPLPSPHSHKKRGP